jgi:hypothetical protein
MPIGSSGKVECLAIDYSSRVISDPFLWALSPIVKVLEGNSLRPTPAWVKSEFPGTGQPG